MVHKKNRKARAFERFNRVKPAQSGAGNEQIHPFFQSMLQRLDLLEQGMGKLIESHAVAFRLVFAELGITQDIRRHTHAELMTIADFIALCRLTVDRGSGQDWESILSRLHGLHTQHREIVKDPTRLVITWATPSKVMDGLLPPSHTLIARVSAPETTTPIDVMVGDQPAAEGAMDTVYLFIEPDAFDRILRRESSTELEFLDGNVGVSDADLMARFNYSLDIAGYLKLQDSLLKKDSSHEDPLEFSGSGEEGEGGGLIHG